MRTRDSLFALTCIAFSRSTFKYLLVSIYSVLWVLAPDLTRRVAKGWNVGKGINGKEPVSKGREDPFQQRTSFIRALLFIKMKTEERKSQFSSTRIVQFFQRGCYFTKFHLTFFKLSTNCSDVIYASNIFIFTPFHSVQQKHIVNS